MTQPSAAAPQRAAPAVVRHSGPRTGKRTGTPLQPGAPRKVAASAAGRPPRRMNRPPRRFKKSRAGNGRAAWSVGPTQPPTSLGVTETGRKRPRREGCAVSLRSGYAPLARAGPDQAGSRRPRSASCRRACSRRSGCPGGAASNRGRNRRWSCRRRCRTHRRGPRPARAAGSRGETASVPAPSCGGRGCAAAEHRPPPHRPWSSLRARFRFGPMTATLAFDEASAPARGPMTAWAGGAFGSHGHTPFAEGGKPAPWPAQSELRINRGVQTGTVGPGKVLRHRRGGLAEARGDGAPGGAFVMQRPATRCRLYAHRHARWRRAR